MRFQKFLTALREADGKLRESDFCCLADICGLPFRDETFGGAISGYTIQHMPDSQQVMAIKELYGSSSRALTYAS
jgi:ubiquinone/menaquinone biosynthesis C-methylase UbiE